MNLQELFEKYKQEDGTIDFESAQSEIDQYTTKVEEEKNSLLAKSKDLLNEKKTEQQKLADLLASREEEETNRQKESGEYKKLYETSNTQLEELKNQLNQFKTERNETAKEKAITKALQDSGIRPEFMRFVKNDFANKAEVVETDEGLKCVARIDGDTLDINEYISKSIQSDEYKPLLSAPVNEGGGASGTSGKHVTAENPFSKASWNVDKQQEIFIKDENLAKQMKEQAE